MIRTPRLTVLLLFLLATLLIWPRAASGTLGPEAATPGIPPTLTPTAVGGGPTATNWPSSTPPVLTSPTPTPIPPWGVNPSTLHLPMVSRGVGSRASIVGAEINASRFPLVKDRVLESRISYVRYNGLRWSVVEPAEGVRRWDYAAEMERDVAELTSQGATPIVILLGTPEWAQKYPGIECGPPRRDALPALANFVEAAVERYSKPPYNVHHWELWNEPDVARQDVTPFSVFGCWGERGGSYFGGMYYAEMLKAVYPAIKRADPDAKVLFGGLLLDCDWTRPPAGRDCNESRFLEGVLRGGGAPYFDILAYHAYSFWNPARADWDRTHPSWRHRGGVTLGKLDFIRTVLAQYGVSKPIMLDETAFGCYPGTTCPEAQLRSDQANYMVRLYARGAAHGLTGVIWYTLDGPGWRDSGLMSPTQQPRATYQTLRFLSSILENARPAGGLGATGLEGYQFTRSRSTVRVVWSNGATPRHYTPPPGAHRLYDRFGNRIPYGGGAILVGFDPLILVTPR